MSVDRTIGPTLVIVVVILGHNLCNSQVSIYRTIGPTLVSYLGGPKELFGTRKK